MEGREGLIGHCTDEDVRSSVEGLFLHVDELLRFIPRMTDEQLAAVWESCPFPGADLQEVLTDLTTWHRIALATLGDDDEDGAISLAG